MSNAYSPILQKRSIIPASVHALYASKHGHYYSNELSEGDILAENEVVEECNNNHLTVRDAV